MDNELVCNSNRQPMWSAGQLKVSVPLLTVAVRLVGLVLTTMPVGHSPSDVGNVRNIET